MFKSIYISNSGIALKGLNLLKASVFKNVNTSYFYKYALYKKVTEPKIKIKGTDNLIIHNHWSAGYHHWLTESLIRLMMVESEKYNLIIPSDYPQFAFDSLEAFTLKKIIKLPIKTGAIVNNLVVPPNPNSGHYKKEQVIALKNHFLNYYNLSTTDIFSKVYVTRRNAAMRKIENEEEVIQFMKKAGFKIIDAELLTFKEQVTLFSSCNYLVSIHGAAITNSIFMPKNSTIIELYREKEISENNMNYCYQRLAEALSLKHSYLYCKTGKNLGNHIDKINLYVNLEELTKTIK